MNAGEIRALGQDIILPICFFAYLAWLIWNARRDE
jgi:hypothetical protein